MFCNTAIIDIVVIIFNVCMYVCMYVGTSVRMCVCHVCMYVCTYRCIKKPHTQSGKDTCMLYSSFTSRVRPLRFGAVQRRSHAETLWRRAVEPVLLSTVLVLTCRGVGVGFEPAILGLDSSKCFRRSFG